MNDRETALVAILITIFAILIWHDYTRDDPEYYSLIITDAYQQQWVVDYNLTLPDCTSMKASPAAECSLQPDGRL